MKTQNLDCDSSTKFLGAPDYQPNPSEFADFTADMRKPKILRQLRDLDFRIYICTCARYTDIHRRPSKRSRTSIEFLQGGWVSHAAVKLANSG